MTGEDEPPDTSPTDAAQRMRRHRARRRAGLTCVSVDIHDDQIAFLVRQRLLDRKARRDRAAIKQAVEALLEETRRLRDPTPAELARDGIGIELIINHETIDLLVEQNFLDKSEMNNNNSIRESLPEFVRRACNKYISSFRR